MWWPLDFEKLECLFAGKPIIGITGGIGSGKSFVARLFGELGCAVLDADAHVNQAYADPHVRQTIRQWWGDSVLLPAGDINRAEIARRIFQDPPERKRLENLLHPLVGQLRQKEMEKQASEPGVVAFVWDTPLLFEAGLNPQCDAVVFVDAPLELRLRRVSQSRGWDEAELGKRENSQLPLDSKRRLSDDIIQNTADAGYARSQVRDVLSRILARAAQSPKPK